MTDKMLLKISELIELLKEPQNYTDNDMDVLDELKELIEKIVE